VVAGFYTRVVAGGIGARAARRVLGAIWGTVEGIFFRNLSGRVLQDDVSARLLTFPNVLISSDQAFLTCDALANIANTTLANVRAFEHGKPLSNEVRGTEVLTSTSVSARER
jgi:hypothetical protein